MTEEPLDPTWHRAEGLVDLRPRRRYSGKVPFPRLRHFADLDIDRVWSRVCTGQGQHSFHSVLPQFVEWGPGPGAVVVGGPVEQDLEET